MGCNDGNGFDRWRDWALRALVIATVGASFGLGLAAWGVATEAKSEVACLRVSLAALREDVREIKQDVKELLRRKR